MNSVWLFLLWLTFIGASMCLSDVAPVIPLPFEATFKDDVYVKFYVNIETDVNELSFSTFFSEKPKGSTAEQFQIMPSRTAVSKQIDIELSLHSYHNNSQIFILWSESDCKTCYCDSREVVKLYIDDEAHRDMPRIKEYNNATFYLNTTECKAKPTLKIFSTTDKTEVDDVVTLDWNSQVNLGCYNRFPNTTIYWMNDVTKVVLHEGTILETQLSSGTKLSCIEVYNYESGSYKKKLIFSRSAVVKLIENVPVSDGRSWIPPAPTITAATVTTTEKVYIPLDTNTETSTTTLSPEQIGWNLNKHAHNQLNVSIIMEVKSILNLSCVYQLNCSPYNTAIIWYYKKEFSNTSIILTTCKCKKNIPCMTAERMLSLTEDFNNTLFHCNLFYNGTVHETINSYRITLQSGGGETQLRRKGTKNLLYLVPTLLVVSVLLGVGIFIAYKCYKTRTTKARQPRLNGNSVPGVEVETYACPQEVTYAQLEMNNTRRANLKMDEVEPYAEVIGVLAPVNKAGGK